MFLAQNRDVVDWWVENRFKFYIGDYPNIVQTVIYRIPNET